jgi:hypothetical protein
MIGKLIFWGLSDKRVGTGSGAVIIKNLSFKKIKEHGGNTLIATPRYEDAAQCTSFSILDVYTYDELLSRKEIEDIGFRFIEPEDADLIFDCFELKIEKRKER